MPALSLLASAMRKAPARGHAGAQRATGIPTPHALAWTAQGKVLIRERRAGDRNSEDRGALDLYDLKPEAPG